MGEYCFWRKQFQFKSIDISNNSHVVVVDDGDCDGGNDDNDYEDDVYD